MRRKFSSLVFVAKIVIMLLIGILLFSSPAVAVAATQQPIISDHGDIQDLTMVPSSSAVIADGSGSIFARYLSPPAPPALVPGMPAVPAALAMLAFVAVIGIAFFYRFRQHTTYLITGFTLTTLASPLSAATRGVMTTYGRHWRDVGILPRLVLTAVAVFLVLTVLTFMRVAWDSVSYVAIGAFAITIFATALVAFVTAPLLFYYGWQSLCRAASSMTAKLTDLTATWPLAQIIAPVHHGVSRGSQASGRNRRDAGILPHPVLGVT